MDVTTYRYLFSALIQVFGALIAVDAIFLILRHGSIEKRIDLLLKQIGLQIMHINKYHAPIPTEEAPHVIDIFEPATSFFLTYSQPEVERVLETTRTGLIAQISDLRRERETDKIRPTRRKAIDQKAIPGRENALAVINELESQYKNKLGMLTRMPQTVLGIMGIPAFLAVIFSISLALTDYVRCFLFGIAIIAIILSIIGFSFIVYFARRTFLVE